MRPRTGSTPALVVAVVPALLAAAGCAKISGKPEGWEGVSLVRASVAGELLRDSPDILIIDLRSPEAYAEAHLADAVNIPFPTLDQRLEGFRTGGGRSSLLLYCDDEDCGRQAVRILHDHGFRYTFLIEGGLDAWIAAGYPTEQEGPAAEPAAGAEDAGETSVEDAGEAGLAPTRGNPADVGTTPASP